MHKTISCQVPKGMCADQWEGRGVDGTHPADSVSIALVPKERVPIAPFSLMLLLGKGSQINMLYPIIVHLVLGPDRHRHTLGTSARQSQSVNAAYIRVQRVLGAP